MILLETEIGFMEFEKFQKQSHIVNSNYCNKERIAAYKNKLHFVSCELDQEYFQAQEKRFANFKSQLTLF